MIDTLGLIYGLSAAIIFSAYGLLSRVLAVKSENPLALSVLYNLSGAALAIPLIFILGGEFSGISAVVIFVTFIAIFFYAIHEATQFFSRKYLEASRSTVLSQLAPVVTLAGAVIFLSESLSLTKLAVVGIIVLGNLVAVYKHGGAITKEGLIFKLISVIALGLAYVFEKSVFEYYPLGFYIFISYLIPALFISPPFFLKGGFASLKNEFRISSWKIPLLGVFAVAGYFFLLKTFQVAEASVAIPITYTATIFVSIGGIVILRERGNILQKLIGAVLVFAGVVLLR